MAFIATGGGDKKEPDPSKKKPEQQVEELSLAGLQERDSQEKLERALSRLKEKERSLEEAFKGRLAKAEDDLRREYARQNADVEERLRSLSKEAAERQKSLDREHQKSQLLESQVDSGRERLRALEKELFNVQSKLKDRLSEAEQSRREKDSVRADLDGERRQLKESQRKLAEAEKKIRDLEALAAESRKAPPPAGSRPEPPAEPAPGAKPSPRPQRGPVLPPVPGRLQRRFDDLTRVRKGSENVIIQVVQLILEEAARIKASDIHLEPVEFRMRVRFRIDGMLEEMLVVPDTRRVPAIQRVRVMCGLDPEQGASTAKPQEGRMVVSVDGQDIDLRLSTFPTAYGDKAVLRLIYRSDEEPELSELGFPPVTTEKIRRLIQRPKGMIIITGPAGSGKSTTLYTMLQALNVPTRNIVTLEDPVEMKIPGLNQCTVFPRRGFTFADGLRSILRQDPNVIMVGEIRDSETAEIAMSASLTGHMLLTTLHTNSAAGAVTRLLDMGLEPYLIASAVTAVFAQRLIRQVCPDCRESYTPEKAVLEELRESSKRAGLREPLESIRFFRGKGCDTCRGTGYKGRLMLVELLQQFPDFRQKVLEKATLEDIQLAAVSSGMDPLAAHGMRMVAEGKTTLEELFRVVGEQD